MKLKATIIGIAVLTLGFMSRASEVEVEVRYIQFDRADIQAASRIGDLSVESLLRLYRAGKGDLLVSPTVRTRFGKEATTKSVVECIYPTQFVVTPITGGSPNTNKVPGSVGAVAKPSGFQTREVGAILQVMPELASDGQTINISLSSQFIFKPEWKDYGSEYTSSDGRTNKLPMPQPMFPSVAINSSLSVPTNAPVLISGGTPSPDGNKLIYVILQARILK